MQYTCALHWAGNTNHLLCVIFFVVHQTTFLVACVTGEEFFAFSENSFYAVPFPSIRPYYRKLSPYCGLWYNTKQIINIKVSADESVESVFYNENIYQDVSTSRKCRADNNLIKHHNGNDAIK